VHDSYWFLDSLGDSRSDQLKSEVGSCTKLMLLRHQGSTDLDRDSIINASLLVTLDRSDLSRRLVNLMA